MVNQNHNCDIDCQLRLVFYVQPFEADAQYVNLSSQEPIQSDNISIFNEGLGIFDMSSSSNPFRKNLNTWTVSN